MTDGSTRSSKIKAGRRCSQGGEVARVLLSHSLYTGIRGDAPWSSPTFRCRCNDGAAGVEIVIRSETSSRTGRPVAAELATE